MRIVANLLKGRGLTSVEGMAQGEVVTDAGSARALVAQCPHYDATPLVSAPGLASAFNVADISVKDERGRMGLGSFKALGAAFAIAKMADRAAGGLSGKDVSTILCGQTFVCASAGNHGLSMVAGAKLFGADAVVYLSETVPQSFACKLADMGAKVVRHGADYEQSMAGALTAAADNDWVLVSDSSWQGYADVARDVMEGYLVMADEVAGQIDQPPSHIFVQAGVGGLAAAVTAAARHHWGAAPIVIVVEPENAPALIESIEAGRPVVTSGPVSAMGRLDCKEPSHLALKLLAREADFFMTISEDEAAQGLAVARTHDLASSPSGAAGVAGFVAARNVSPELAIGADSRVLFYLSEGEVVD